MIFNTSDLFLLQNGLACSHLVRYKGYNVLLVNLFI